jgi:hypothetical protein
MTKSNEAILHNDLIICERHDIDLTKGRVGSQACRQMPAARRKTAAQPFTYPQVVERRSLCFDLSVSD